MMAQTDWKHYWRRAASDPALYAALTLVALNGLRVEQVEALDRAQVDLERSWLSTADGETYPLVSYARDALAALPDNCFAPETWLPLVRELRPLEMQAQQRLSGAIWYTSEEGQLLLNQAGLSVAPILPLRFVFPFSVVGRLNAEDDSAVAQNARQVLQAAADWLYRETVAEKPALTTRILGALRQGSMIFLIASTGVSGLNLIHNIVMGRLLSPADYGQLTFIITLQLLIGLLPTAIQVVVARFGARYHAQGDEAALVVLRRYSGRLAWQVGVGAALGVLALSPLFITLFQLSGLMLLVPMIAVIPLFVRLGADRGLLQSMHRYLWLSGAFLSEGVIRLGVGAALGYALLASGHSLEGAVWGLAQSVIVTWLISALALRHFRPSASAQTDTVSRDEWLRLGGLTLVALVGQALITNSDFLLVKNLFSPADAGLYASVTVLGRIVYFGALPLNILLVPMIARRQALDQPTQPILLLMLGGGVVACGLLIGAAALFAPTILGTLYGESYTGAAGLLAPYALAASLYTLANLAITYRIALGKGGETWMPLLAGAMQIAAILLFHDTLEQVVIAQIALMTLLLIGVLVRVWQSRSAAPTAMEGAVAAA